MDPTNIDSLWGRLFPERYEEHIPDRTNYVDVFGVILDFAKPVVLTDATKKRWKREYKTKETPEIAKLWTAFVRKPTKERWKTWVDAVAEHHKIEYARRLKPSVSLADKARDAEGILVKTEALKAAKEAGEKEGLILPDGQLPKLILPGQAGSGDPLLDAERELLRARVRTPVVIEGEEEEGDA